MSEVGLEVKVNRKSLWDFVWNRHFGPSVNLLVSWVLFWALGFPAVLQYGYSDSVTSRNADFSIASGPLGSGVLPITSLFMIVATLMWIAYLVHYYRSSSEDL